MHRVFSDSASNGKIRKPASGGNRTASAASISSPVQTANAELTVDEAVFSSGTARERRRLKRKDKVAKGAVDNLPEPSADIMPVLAAALSDAPTSATTEEGEHTVTLGNSYLTMVRNEVDVQHVQGNYSSERQILEHALEYYFTLKRAQ